jgi:hypothetical protein
MPTMRRIKRHVEVLPNPSKDIHGKPMRRLILRWWDSHGTQHTGEFDISALVDDEFPVKPGDHLEITVEVFGDY